MQPWRLAAGEEVRTGYVGLRPAEVDGSATAGSMGLVARWLKVRGMHGGCHLKGSGLG